MAQDPVQRFFNRDEPRSPVDNGPVSAPLPYDKKEIFQRGMQSGAEGMGADIAYFKGLFNTLIGDEDAAANNIREARFREELAATPVEGLETFEEFINEPTFDGFLTQAAKGGGQVLPYAVFSVASAGTGAVTALLGRGVLNAVGRQAANRIIKDSVERTAKGVADPTERQIAELAYGSLRSATKKGAIAGAFGAEFVPMSGDNLSEALESGRELDRGTALRAAAVGVPQAAIGVGGELALVKLIGQAASKRAAVQGGTFSELAKKIGVGLGKGALVEGAAESAQETISIANRAQMDPTFTREDANMRFLESAFLGVITGGAIGGAGSAVGGTVGAIRDSQPGQTLIDGAANVFDKARRLLNRGQEQRVNDQINREQFGDLDSGFTTPEPRADIQGQLEAIVDQTSGKQAAWIAGETPEYDAMVGTPTEINVGGTTVYGAFVPGRGTIIARTKELVQEVVAAGASEQSLQLALGYSAVKDPSNPGDLVVQVLDRKGRVISEEVTTAANLPAAQQAADRLKPEGGTRKILPLDEAMEDRKRRFESEVKTRNMELFESLTPEQQQELLRLREQQSQNQVDEADADDSEIDQFGQGIQAVEGQRTLVRAYGRKADPARTFDNTAEARANFESVFGQTNWADPRFAAMTESMLNAAANEQRSNPDSAVSIEDIPDGGFQIVRDDFGDLFRSINADGTESRLNVESFLKAAIQRAKQSKFARNSRVVVVGPDGKKSPVNLVDLTAAGQRLVEGREGAGFQMRQDRRSGETFLAPEAAARAGLLEILGDLAIEGYDVQIDGQSILRNRQRIPQTLGNVTAAIVGGKRESLNWLLRPPRFRQQTQEERETTMLQEQALSERPDEVADGQPETDRMAESRVRGDELRTQMNIDTPASAIDRRAAVPSIQTEEKARLRVQLAVDTMVQQIINDLLDTLQFKNPPQIFSFTKLNEMTAEQLEQLIPDAALREAMQRALEYMRSNESRLGQHISGPTGKIIILRESGNVLQDALVAAHELGHSLYKEERDGALSNRALRERLIKAFEKSPTYKGLKERYGFDGGFEEWFSDQVALWASKRYKNRQAKNMVEKFFKDFVARLNKLWRSTSDTFRKRFSQGVSQDFEQFMDAVLESRRSQVKENGLSFTEKALSYELNDMVIESGGQALAMEWKASIQRMLKNPNVMRLMKIVRSADGMLRAYAGNEIADMFYVRSQQGGKDGRLGMLDQRSAEFSRLTSKFREEIGEFASPEVQAAMEEAATSIPTDLLANPKARQVRKFLVDLYDEYILPSNTKLGRQENFFPVVINLLAVSDNPQGFIDAILAENPKASPDAVKKAVESIVEYQQEIQNAPDVHVNPLNPANSVKQSIELTKNVRREAIKDYLVPPTDAFYKYLRQVTKRVEFDRATKDANGKSRLEALLAKLNDEDRKQAEEIISVYLGYQVPLSPIWRKVNSYGMFLQFITILPFATFASLTDLAGPVINSKEFGGLTMGLKEIIRTIKNRKEAEQFALDLGVVTHETVANVWVTEAEQDFMEDGVRKASDAWFNLIGLNFLTRFSREFAANMGVQFILKHARNEFNNPRSERYLSELGLTREDVLAWEKGGRKLSTPEGLKVRQALQRFVKSSILRPNAAERPVWGSDPHWALVWQLKSFFYSYGKVIMGGVKREALTRLGETPGSAAQKISASMAVIGLTAIATMPLAMMGLELREYAKFGLAAVLPGVDADRRYFRSDRMDWPEYLADIFDRSGMAGPMAILGMSSQAAEWGRNPIVPLFGPTAEMIETFIRNGAQVDRTIKDRLFPIVNQI